jgi:hypothetical protein
MKKFPNPAGINENSPQFQLRVEVEKRQSPAGTTETFNTERPTFNVRRSRRLFYKSVIRHFFSRPFGTRPFFILTRS